MSFSFYNMNTTHHGTDVTNNYQELGEEFCKHYYTIYDNNFRDLGHLFGDNPRITFMDSRYGHYGNLLSDIYAKGIWDFTHHEINGNSQPIGQYGLLVNITGTLSVNQESARYHFTETVILEQGTNGNWHIHNLIFKVLD